MVSRTFKLRFRRKLRRRKIQAQEISQQASFHFERNFFRRLERLANVRRFVVTWVLLIVLLGAAVVGQISALRGYYQDQSPVAGGTFIEGALGSFSDANPLFASSPVDQSVAKLVFSGLVTYDQNGKLTGDLAKEWKVDETGKMYTVTLRNNISWHDGQPFTAKDVVYTYNTIQNPEARSPLAASWRGVKVTQTDDHTIVFRLPNALVSFPYALTNGIVPAHILEKEPPSSLRTLPFNTKPIGSGPFEFKTIDVSGGSAETRQESIGLERFELYHRGTPKLQRYIYRAYRNKDQLFAAFKEHKLTAMSGVSVVPSEITKTAAVRQYSLPLAGMTMAFMRNSNEILAEKTVRQAIVRVTDQKAILASLGYSALPVKSPFLQGQVGYDSSLLQLEYNLDEANKLLDDAGWQRGADGIRSKGEQRMSFMLAAIAGGEYENVARILADQWSKAGIDIQVMPQDVADFQQTLLNHDYDILLHGISLGPDPDVVVYWDSKYADVRADSDQG